MQVLKQHKLITAILPRGKSIDVMEKLRSDKDIVTASVNTARGMGKLMPGVYRGLGGQAEKEILEVIIAEDRADEIFEYLYETAEIDRPHGGIIFMAKVRMTTPYTLPVIPEAE